jgi:hypothetical protein
LTNGKDRANKFLENLAALTQEYGVFIDSCGCCDSMWIKDEKSHVTLLSVIAWDGKEYT